MVLRFSHLRANVLPITERCVNNYGGEGDSNPRIAVWSGTGDGIIRFFADRDQDSLWGLWVSSYKRIAFALEASKLFGNR
jgi:hypothetical protein